MAASEIVKSTILELSDIDRPDFQKALDAWERLRCGSDIPVWHLPFMLTVPHRFIRTATIVDVVENGLDYRFRFWGSGLTEAFGIDDTGNLLRSNPPASTAGTIDQLDKVVATRAPVYCVSTVHRPDRYSIDKINLRMPFTDGGADVRVVMTVSEMSGEICEGDRHLPWAQVSE